MANDKPKAKKKTQHLTIHMVKEEFKTVASIVSAKATEPPLDVAIPGAPGVLYVHAEPRITPSWVPLFNDFVSSNIGTVSSLSAALILKTAGRYFILTFGNGRHLIKADAFEERFGLLVVLNSVDPKSIRVVDMQSLDAIQSHSRIQSGEETTADQFGLDVEQDMLKAIVGAPKTENLGTRMAGADPLSVSVRMDLSDLPALLKLYKAKFEEELHPDYSWVHNIRQLKKTSATVAALDAKLVNKLKTGDHDNIWLSVPEVIDWTKVVGFMFTHGGRRRYPDIDLRGFLATNSKESITLELLHSIDVQCADEDNRSVERHWPVYRCIYAEIDHDGEKYVLNGGLWFEVNKDFVATTNSRFATTPYTSLQLPEYTGGDEGKYNEDVADKQPTVFALLDDKKKIFHGGGHGQVEACDLFTTSKQLIHIKRYGKSSVLSHLFAQGFVSGQLIQIDEEFRKKVRAKLKTPFAELINVKARPADKEFTIIFAVISNAPGKKLNLPFFSRVNFNNTAKILEGFGYSVELMKIDWEENYAKTVKAAAQKKKKLV